MLLYYLRTRDAEAGQVPQATTKRKYKDFVIMTEVPSQPRGAPALIRERIT